MYLPSVSSHGMRGILSAKIAPESPKHIIPTFVMVTSTKDTWRGEGFELRVGALSQLLNVVHGFVDEAECGV
jgi:hypothetical protein